MQVERFWESPVLLPGLRAPVFKRGTRGRIVDGLHGNPPFAVLGFRPADSHGKESDDSHEHVPNYNRLPIEIHYGNVHGTNSNEN